MNKKVSKNIFAFTICLLPYYFLYSQEVIVPLKVNTILANHYHQLVTSKKFHSHSSLSDTLSLPFLDDFSKESIYPDTSLWIDKDAFINRDYPIAPPTIGVATLDGVGPSGMPYDTLASSSSSNPADTLTSKPINLNLLPSDSVYFSFFWQAKGRGNSPDITDSLLLQFKNPSIANDSFAWKTVWYHTGFTTPPSDSSFHLVMIRVDVLDTGHYLQNGFQFRFRNWATTSGNVDHWHIDYVYLAKNRNAADTIFNDVAFEYNSPSFLQNYTAMPWEQYKPSEIKTSLNNIFIRNNDTAALGKNTSFNYKLYDNTGSVVSDYSGVNGNILPYRTHGLCNNPAFDDPCIGTLIFPNPCVPYSFPTLTDTASFECEFAIHTSPDKDNWNDTLQQKQKFYDYYSYDDGTAEGGYGLMVQSLPPYPELAYKFTLNNTDTLVAVQMLFNWIVTDVSKLQFRITLWSDAGGIPGSIIYQDSVVTPEFNYVAHHDWGNLTNDFHTYMLTSPKILSGTFYVGWEQFTPETLNLGLDLNTNALNKMYYNVDGSTWYQSTINIQNGGAAWMMRPVFRNANSIQAVNNINDSPHVKVFPNPSNGMFNVKWIMDNGDTSTIKVYDLTGKIIYNTKINSSITQLDFSDFNSGIYFLQIESSSGKQFHQKLIIAK